MDLTKNLKDKLKNGDDDTPLSENEIKTSFLGSTVKIKGNITSDNSIIIEGRINGNVSAREKITIQSGGNVSGRIEADILELFGTAKGDIATRKRTDIHRSAKFNGNIVSDKVTIEEGGIFNGNMNMPEKKGS